MGLSNTIGLAGPASAVASAKKQGREEEEAKQEAKTDTKRLKKMARDKTKELKTAIGVDDKAITFQRAVFIFCKLMRLIKRPKKDNEKQ